MANYTGNEFQNEKGTPGANKRWIWAWLYVLLNGIKAEIAAIGTSLSNYYTKGEVDSKISEEATSRANADLELEAKILGLKTITTWNPADAFPSLRKDGKSFEAGNFVQITANGVVGGVTYKAGDMLICTADVTGSATVDNFADVDANVDIATSTIYGSVKLLADLAAYQSSGNDTAVIDKVVLQAILTDFSNTITSAFQEADQNLQDNITLAYEQAIAGALANYVTLDYLQGNFTTKDKTTGLALLVKDTIKDALLHVYSKFIFGFRRLEISGFTAINSFVFDISSSYRSKYEQISCVVSVTINGWNLRVAEITNESPATISTFAATGQDADKYDAVVVTDGNGTTFLIFDGTKFNTDDISTAIVTVGVSLPLDYSQLEQFTPEYYLQMDFANGLKYFQA